ncbi:MAG: peptidase inhibitor family I36 protein [Pseudonocardiaceae bacterium]
MTEVEFCPDHYLCTYDEPNCGGSSLGEFLSDSNSGESCHNIPGYARSVCNNWDDEVIMFPDEGCVGSERVIEPHSGCVNLDPPARSFKVRKL